MDLRNWLTERFTPVVMVVASPEAEALCAERNGISVVELLRPFGYFHHLSVPVRTVGEQSYRIREFRLRFFTSDTIFQPAQEVADEYLKAVLTQAASELRPGDVSDVLAALQKGEPTQDTPWFDKYRREFYRMLQFGDHETYDHPVACLVVVHAHAEAALDEAARLLRGAALPPLMREGQMEPNLLKHYLLLHDEQRDSSPAAWQRAEEQLRVMRGNLGAGNVTLLRVNTAAAGGVAAAGYEGLWRAHMRGNLSGGGAGEPATRPPVPAGGLGAALAQADLDGVRAFLEDLTIRALLPHLELRVRSLNQQVAATRKGLRNQLKTFLWRKSSSDLAGGRIAPGAAAPSTPQQAYGHNTVEGQMRQLADLAFMMQDYDTALSTLRLAATDYKADKAWKHYAGVQEMLGLTSFMTGAAIADVVAHFKEAHARYTAGPGPRPSREWVRYATRANMLLAEYCRQHSQWGEAKNAFWAAHYQEEIPRSALLLEQAAHCLLQGRAKSVRRFAFYCILAGLRYNSCDQRALATRAYQQVLSVYKGREWAMIEEHLHDVLGKNSREAGHLMDAVAHFAAMMPCHQSPPYWQNMYLQQFLDTVSQAARAQGGEVVLELPLPAVDLARVAAAWDDTVVHGCPAARSVPDDVWRRLEAPLLPGSDQNLSSWLDAGGSRSSLAAQAAARTAVAGEAVSAQLEVSNPLALQLSVTRLRLLLDWEPSAGAPADDDVQVEEVEVTLAPGQRVRVSLTARPKRTGTLTLRGIRWLLNGHAQGQRLFVPPKPRHRRSSSRISRDPARLGGSQLSWSVVPPMPRLEAELVGLAPSLATGELARCTLRLHNAGPQALTGVRMVVSNPDVHVGRQAGGAGPGPGQAQDLLAALDGEARHRPELESTSGGGGQGVTVAIVKGGHQLVTWPPGLTLQSGAMLDWPLWLHPRGAGQLHFNMVWHFEPVSPVEGMKYRVLRYSHTLNVTPSLRVIPSLTVCPDDLHRLLLRLDVETAPGATPMRLRQLTCTSHGWRLSPLPPPADTPDTTPVSPSGANPPAPAWDGGRPATPPSGEEASTSLVPNLALGPGTTTLFFHLHPPSTCGTTGPPPPGAAWLPVDAGPLRHFHDWRRRALLTAGQAGRRGSQTAEAWQPLPLPPDWGADMLLVAEIQGGSESELRLGAFHLFNLRLKEEVPLRTVVRGSRHLRHDFSSQPVCTASLTLCVRNCLSCPASLHIEAGSQPRPSAGMWTAMGSLPEAETTDSAQSQLSASLSDLTLSSGGPLLSTSGRSLLDLHPTGDYVWTGRTRSNVPFLAGGQTVHIPLQVAVFFPGTYEVADYALSWTFPALDNLHASGPGPPVLLTVEDVQVLTF